MQANSREKMRSDGPDVEHLVYTDGIASLSVYVEPVTAEGAISGLTSVGAVSAFGLTGKTHQVTVVGEVPGETARRVAQAVIRVL